MKIVYLAALALLPLLPLMATEASAAEASTATSGPSSLTEAKMLVERAKQEIAQEEKTWAEEVAREKEAEARRRQRYAEFGQDRIRLQQSIAEQEAKLKATLVKMETHQYRDRELQARFKQLSQVLAVRAKELRAAVALGLPYSLEKRKEALDLLVRDLEGANISPEEAMNRLWAFEQNERRLAQEAEVYTGDFSEGAGDPIQVQYLRVGKQLLAFSSLDGTKLGVMRTTMAAKTDSTPARPSYEWVRETEMDRDTRNAIKHAIAVSQSKAIPGFVPLPVWKSAFTEQVAVNTAVENSSATTPTPGKAPAKAASSSKAATK